MCFQYPNHTILFGEFPFFKVGWLPCLIGNADDCLTQIGISYGPWSLKGWYWRDFRFPAITYGSVVLDRWHSLWLEAVVMLLDSPIRWSLVEGLLEGVQNFLLFLLYQAFLCLGKSCPADISWMCDSDNEWGQHLVWYGMVCTSNHHFF